MSTQNLQDNLNWLLIRSSTMAKQGLLRISEQYELTPLQLLTLCLLDPTDAVAMSAIADLLVCDPSNVTGIVDKLSGLGYIERRESIVDRRVKTIKLTPEGVSFRARVLPVITENTVEAASLLSQDEISMLKSLLVKIVPEAVVKQR